MHFGASSILGLAALLLTGLVLAIIAATWYTIYLLTHPPRRTYASALARSRPGDPGQLPPGPRGQRKWSSWKFEHKGLSFPVWDIEGDKPEAPAMILSHGWGDSRIGGLSRVPGLAANASRLFLWDMPGHGEAPGTCKLGTSEVDALRALMDRVGGELILYGWSLGAGISIAAAARHERDNGRDAGSERVPERRPGSSPTIFAVIAEAPYRLPWTPARNVLRTFGLPWRINLPLAMALLGTKYMMGERWTGFDRAEIAAKLKAPLMVLHGKNDDICPIEDGRAIADAGPHTFVELNEGGHHSLWTDPKTAAICEASVTMFLTVSACCGRPKDG